MKKLLAIILALSMVVSLGCVVLADEASLDFGDIWGAGGTGASDPDSFVGLEASIPQKGYAAGEIIDVVVNISSVALDKITLYNNKLPVDVDDGVSALSFEILYNKDFVTPVALPEDSEEGNATSLLTANPGWEGLGKIDYDNGSVDVAFGDTSAAALKDVKVVSKKTLSSFSFKMSFTVNDNVSEDDIVFSFANVEAYNLDGTKACSAVIEDVSIVDAAKLPQPPTLVELPEDAFAITHAGYQYEAGVTVIYYADEDITLHDYINRAMGEDHKSNDMNYYAVIICDENNVVTHVNTAIGRPGGVKGDTVVPAGSYLIGVNGWSEEYAPFSEIVEVGSVITLYNVNLNGTNVKVGAEPMTQAGFTVYTETDIQPDELVDVPAGATEITNAGYIHAAGATVILATDKDTTIGELVLKGDPDAFAAGEAPDMNYWSILICDTNGIITYKNTVLGRETVEGIKTDVAVPAGGFVIGAHAGNDAISAAKLGQKVDLYNIVLEGVINLQGNKKLNKAAFTVSDVDLVIADGAAATFVPEKNKVVIYKSGLSVKDVKAMFVTEIEILDKDGKAVTSGLVKTGMTIDFNGATVIILGDINSDGEVTAKDYGLVKRFVLKTLKLEGAQLEAACITGKDVPVANDYALVKRHCLKTYDLINLKK